MHLAFPVTTNDDHDVYTFVIEITPKYAKQILHQMDLVKWHQTYEPIWRHSFWAHGDIKAYGADVWSVFDLTGSPFVEVPPDEMEGEPYEEIEIDCCLMHVTENTVSWEANLRKSEIEIETFDISRATVEGWAKEGK